MFSETSFWNSISKYIKTASSIKYRNGTKSIFERRSYVCLHTSQNVLCICGCILTFI